MHRPLGVSLIAALFFLWGFYLLVAGTTLFVSPTLLANIALAYQLRYGLELGGPYLTLAVGTLWVLIGCGLWFRYRWARWVAMLPFILAFASLLADAIILRAGLHLLSFARGLQAAGLLVVIWYLSRRQTAEYFQKPTNRPN